MLSAMLMYGKSGGQYPAPNDITTGGVPVLPHWYILQQDCRYNMFNFGINFLTVIACYRIVRWKFSIKTFLRFYPDVSLLPIIQQLTRRRSPTERPAFHGMFIEQLLWRGIGIAFSSNGSTAERILSPLLINKYRTITLGGSCCFVTLSSSLPATSC